VVFLVKVTQFIKKLVYL